MKTKQKQIFSKKIIVVAISAAIHFIFMRQANADCTVTTAGTSASGLGLTGALCTNGNQSYTNSSTLLGGSSISSSTRYSVVIQGLGNTLTNQVDSTISSTGTTAGGSRYGVLIGEFTPKKDSTSSVVTSGSNGSSTLTITLPTAAVASGSGKDPVTASNLVGQTIVLTGEIVDGELRPGNVRKILSAVANTSTSFTITVDYPVSKNQAGNTYNIIAGSGVNVVNNYGTITGSALAGPASTSSTYGTLTARAIDTSVQGDYVINNKSSGTIQGVILSAGTAQGIDAGGNVTNMQINNEGTIKATRNEAITLTLNRYDFLRATSTSTTTAANVGSSAAIYSQEELERIEINNKANAYIIGEGLLNPAIYLRAAEQEIDNKGNVFGSRLGTSGSYTYGMAIASVSDSGEIRKLSLNNSGTINGSILGVNSNAYRWYALSNYDVNGSAAVNDSTNLNERLKTNASNWGQLDAAIVNSNVINGNIYLSNGEHVITNTGSIVGSIDLDQRDTQVVQQGQGKTSLTAIQASSAYTDSDGNSNTVAKVYSGSGAGGTINEGLGANTIQTAVVKKITTQSSKSETFEVYNIDSPRAGVYKGNQDGLTLTSSVINADSLGLAATADATTFSGLFTVVGAKEFTFNNNGNFTGDILIHTASSSALISKTVASDVTLSPYIYGEGSTNVNSPNSDKIHGFVGDLIVLTDAGTQIDDNVTIAPKASAGTIIKDGQYYKVANHVYTDIAKTALATDTPSVVGNGLVSWTASYNGSDALVIQSHVDASGVAGVSYYSSSALNALMTADSILGAQVQNLASAESVRKASEQIRPEINGASHQASTNVTDKVFGLVGSRLDEIHLASIAGRSGVATGDETRTSDGTGLWMQAFGAKGNQDKRSGFDGYKTDAYGFALGADQLIDDETRVGFVGSYGQSRVISQGDNLGDRTSIDSYQGAVYGSTILRKIYLNVTLGLGYHDYTSDRLVLNNGVKGSHEGWQYSGKLDVGYPIKFNAVTLVPVASLAYSRLAESGYTESGVGALALGSRDTDSFKTGLGTKVLVPLFDNTVSAGLELRALWQHEFADASIDSTARFVQGGASFTTKGVELERDSANLGASLRLFGVMDGVKQSLNLNYDAELKSQYINQTASLQARFDF